MCSQPRQLPRDAVEAIDPLPTISVGQARSEARRLMTLVRRSYATLHPESKVEIIRQLDGMLIETARGIEQEIKGVPCPDCGQHFTFCDC